MYYINMTKKVCLVDTSELYCDCMLFPLDNSCPPTWDAWTCFDRASAGASIKKQCSPYSYIAHPPRCLRKWLPMIEFSDKINRDLPLNLLQITATKIAFQMVRGTLKPIIPHVR